MPVRIGTTEPADFRLGASQVDRLYLGATLVWQKASPLALTVSGQGFQQDLSNPYSTTSRMTANATGGAGTKTYSWTKVSGDTFNVADFGSYADFGQTGTVNNTFNATYRCTVQDDTGSASYDFVLTHNHGNPL